MKFITIFLLLIGLNLHSQSVYKTPSGQKYHLKSCRMVKNFSTMLNIKSASGLGLTPCNICKPPYRSSNVVIKTKSKASGENGLSRCKGKTKKGVRCKRNTSIGNDYCFQHIP